MGSKPKLIAAILFIVAAATWGYLRTRAVTPGTAANNGVTGEFPINQEQMRERFQEAAREAKITPEQMEKLQELRDSADETTGRFEAMRTAWQDVLTSEQRQTLRQNFQARRAEREQKMRAALGDKEFERFQQKMQERFRGMGGRGPGGGRGGRPGGPNAPAAGGPGQGV